MSESQLATKRNDIRSVLTKMQGEFKDALPKLLTPERFTRVALTCINKNPKLLQCTQESLLACLLDCASLGIEPDGRRAHLIPYGDKCTLIIDYKGIAELVRRSGEVADLHADIICENDDFDYMFGTGSFLRHKIDIRKERGEVIGAYSYVKLKDNSESFDVMGVAEIEKVRQRSRSGNNGPWVTDKAEMQKKTVFRRHSKWLPLSPELRDKIEKDEEPLTEQERFAAAKPANASSIEFGDPLPASAFSCDGLHGEPPCEDPQGCWLTKASADDKKGGKKKAEKPAPPRATALEGLRNLMAASKIEEPQLLAYLFGQNLVQQGEKLETMDDKRLKDIIDSWMSIAPDIQKEA